MYFPESALLANKFPAFADALACIDDVLGDYAGRSVDMARLKLFCEEVEEQEFNEIWNLLVEEGLLISKSVGLCAECRDQELTPQFAPQAQWYCDICGTEFDDNEVNYKQVYMVRANRTEMNNIEHQQSLDLKPVKVLSIDGGGIRGIIPATILAELESTGTPVCKMFDLIAGTSTGGILALGLTIPAVGRSTAHTALEMVGLYKKHGEQIFPAVSTKWLDKLRDFSRPRYSVAGLEAVLKEFFGNSHLREAAIETLVTAYETVRRQPYYFTRQDALQNSKLDFQVRDIARATSAAPTYFPPLKLEIENDKDTLTLIDGGLAANNPSSIALSHAMRVFPGRRIILVSIGTGKCKKAHAYEKIKGWGPLQWARPIIDLSFDGSDEVIHYCMQEAFERFNLNDSGNYRYERIQVELSETLEAMDNANADNINACEAVATRYISNRKKELNDLRVLLTS